MDDGPQDRRDALDVGALRAIVDALPLFVNVKTRDSRYVYMNAFQAATYGTTPALAVGRTAAELLGADYGAYTGGIDRMVLETGKAVANLDERYAGIDGRERDWLTTKLPWRGADGATQGVVTIALDVTDKKASERALADALVRSEAANRAKTAFIRTVSHELRTPLNAVMGFGELIAGGDLPPARAAEYARLMLESAHGLLALIDGVIELSSLSGGGAPYPAAPSAIDEAVAGAMAGAEEAAKARNIALVAAVEPDLPSLRCERAALRRMLDPLIANAIKFGREGGTASVTATRAEGGGIRVIVADDGIGIAPEDIAACLEPFGQVESGLTRRHGGIGLGLPLVKAQIEAHGGTLALESRKGAFTRVTIVFPPGRVA
ncbi:MAG: PAS domain-containing sensor histidine kinase [Azospirillum sp.]|nr:PAS domain-containing sensor histidine kinase [Azospirillum sp.]MCZ8124412.1 PAS domain-containing sensor histidine kinase [Magnetospirillum sp.]